MTLETGTYVDDLNLSYPEGTAQKSRGDDHIRLIKKVLLNTFKNITGAITATQDDINQLTGNQNVSPVGLIAMWSGSVANIPAGWELCDGGSTTDRDGNPLSKPDLRGRMILGADNTSYSVAGVSTSADRNTAVFSVSGDQRSDFSTSMTIKVSGSTGNDGEYTVVGVSYTGSVTELTVEEPVSDGTADGSIFPYPEVDDTGGEDKHLTTENEMPSHDHGGSTGATDPFTENVYVENPSSVDVVGTGGADSATTSESHSHSIPSDGGDWSHENRPPWYSLAYIIKL